jgi:hypothetical protein
MGAVFASKVGWVSKERLRKPIRGRLTQPIRGRLTQNRGHTPQALGMAGTCAFKLFQSGPGSDGLSAHHQSAHSHEYSPKTLS